MWCESLVTAQEVFDSILEVSLLVQLSRVLHQQLHILPLLLVAERRRILQNLRVVQVEVAGSGFARLALLVVLRLRPEEFLEHRRLEEPFEEELHRLIAVRLDELLLREILCTESGEDLHEELEESFGDEHVRQHLPQFQLFGIGWFCSWRRRKLNCVSRRFFLARGESRYS